MQPRLLNIIIFGVMRMHDFSNFEIFTLHRKLCFSLILQKIWPNLKFPAGLITFTEEIVNGKLDFFLQCLIFLRYYVINLTFSRYIVLADKIKYYKKKKNIIYLDFKDYFAKYWPTGLCSKSSKEPVCKSYQDLIHNSVSYENWTGLVSLL